MTRLSWQETGSGKAAVVTDEGRRLADYSWSDAKNHPYFSAVRPLQHNGILTNTAPWDHRWHHGLWWSWKFLNGVLYWEDHEGYGGGSGVMGHSVVTGHTVRTDYGIVEISEELEWRPVSSGDPVLRERRSILLHTQLAGVDAWALDWDSVWTAEVPVEFTATPYPEYWWGGYGGLNYRAARSMAAGETIIASEDRTGREAVHSLPGAWGALLGNVDGAGTDEPNAPAFGGVALLAHPGNAPVPIYVFSAADDFGFLATAPLMHRAMQLPAGENLRMRHRAVILGTAVDHSALDRLSRQYGGEEHRHQPKTQH